MRYGAGCVQTEAVQYVVLIMLEYQFGNTVTPCFMMIMVILHDIIFSLLLQILKNRSTRNTPSGKVLGVLEFCVMVIFK